MKAVNYLLFIAVIFVISGCASIMNPYKDDFQCPDTPNGKCVDVKSAYDESIGKKRDKEKVKSLQDEIDEISATRNRDITSPEASQYQTALYNRLKGLLKDPVTPIVAPPQVYRMLFLSYPGDSEELYMPRYVYFFVEKPRCILDNYLNAQD